MSKMTWNKLLGDPKPHDGSIEQEHRELFVGLKRESTRLPDVRLPSDKPAGPKEVVEFINSLYNATGPKKSAKGTIQNRYQLSYQQVVASSPVRALQDKTQVFALDSSDFIRTRLTHSLEVSEIAGHIIDAIAELGGKKDVFAGRKNDVKADVFAGRKDDDVFDGRKDDAKAVARTAGLLHDMGNPPFGHKGEEVIKDWVKGNIKGLELLLSESLEEHKREKVELKPEQRADLERFEGNSQGIRILMREDSIGDVADLYVTKAVIGAMAKYTKRATDYDKETDGKSSIIWNHKAGVYQSEYDDFKAMMASLGIEESKKGIPRHPLAFILEAADDIAYATADFEDAFFKGLVTKEDIKNYSDEFFSHAKKKGFHSSPDYKSGDKTKVEDVSSAEANEWFNRSYNSISEDQMDKAFKALISLLKDGKDVEGPAVREQWSGDEDYAVHWWIGQVREGLIYTAASTFNRLREEIMEGRFTGELLLVDTEHSCGQRVSIKGKLYPYTSFSAATVMTLKAYAECRAWNSSEVKTQNMLAKNYLDTLLPLLSCEALNLAFDLENEGVSLPESLSKVVKSHKKQYKNEELFYQTMRSVLDYVSLLTDRGAKHLAESYETVLGARRIRQIQQEIQEKQVSEEKKTDAGRETGSKN